MNVVIVGRYMTAPYYFATLARGMVEIDHLEGFASADSAVDTAFQVWGPAPVRLTYAARVALDADASSSATAAASVDEVR